MGILTATLGGEPTFSEGVVNGGVAPSRAISLTSIEEAKQN